MKQTTLKLLLLWIVTLAVNAPSRASVSQQVQLEAALEKRISNIVNRYDAMAIIRVNVSFKKLSAQLPGTSIDVKDFAASSVEENSFNQISAAAVTIYTAKAPLPEWLTTEIVKLVPDVRANLDIKKLDEQARASLAVQDPNKLTVVISDFLGKANELSSTISTRIIIALGAVAFGSLLLASLVALGIFKRVLTEANRVIEARLIPVLQNIGNAASESNGSSSKTTVVQATLSAPAGGYGGGGSNSGGGGGNNAQRDIAALSNETLEAIFSDCYWCQKDAYAAWLWSAITPAHRVFLTTASGIDPVYFKMIQVVPKEQQDEHLDPSYLNPLKINHISQDDLARWVEAFLPGYHLLSPIRQNHLPISLKTRLACMSEPLDKKQAIKELPQRPSPKRVLIAIQKLGDITADDEATILHNSAMVPEQFRAQIRSLVWLALRPFEFREKVLGEFSAEELASAWFGSPEVLARLKEVLPEKKRSMLEGYAQSVEINKKAYVYSRLVEAGLHGSRLAESETKKASATEAGATNLKLAA